MYYNYFILALPVSGEQKLCVLECSCALTVAGWQRVLEQAGGT